MSQSNDIDDGIDLIRNRIEEGTLSLTIKSLPMGGGKQPTFQTEDGGFTVTAEEQDAMNAIAKRYADILIRLDDVDSAYDGLERAWQIGDIITEAEKFSEGFSRAELVDLLHVDGMSSTQARRFVKVYEMFPEGSFNPEHSYSLVTEIAVRAESPEHARETYNRMDDADFSLTQYEARAWGHIEETTLEDIAANIAQYVSTSVETQARGVRRLFIVRGADESEIPPKNEIIAELETHQ